MYRISLAVHEGVTVLARTKDHVHFVSTSTPVRA